MLLKASHLDMNDITGDAESRGRQESVGTDTPTKKGWNWEGGWGWEQTFSNSCLCSDPDLFSQLCQEMWIPLCHFHVTFLHHLILPYFNDKLVLIFPSHNPRPLESQICLWTTEQKCKPHHMWKFSSRPYQTFNPWHSLAL